MLTVEFSPTQSKLRTGERDELNIAANFHKGHIVRVRTVDWPNPVPTDVIDVSYPAFLGASGAPVIQDATGLVLGMPLGNFQQHLMPAHFARTAFDGAVVEEISYFPAAW